MSRAPPLTTTQRAVTRLLDCGLTLPSIAGVVHVPVSTLRALHAGYPPEPLAALRLAIAARVLDHFLARERCHAE